MQLYHDVYILNTFIHNMKTNKLYSKAQKFIDKIKLMVLKLNYKTFLLWVTAGLKIMLFLLNIQQSLCVKAAELAKWLEKKNPLMLDTIEVIISNDHTFSKGL